MQKPKLSDEILMKKLQDTKWDSKAKRTSTRITLADKANMLRVYERQLRKKRSEDILEELGGKYNRSPRQIANYIREAREERERKSSSLRQPLVDHEELVKHRQDLKRLAERLRSQLRLPSSWYSFVEDFGESGTHSQYSHDKLKVVFLWEVKEENGVRVRLLCPVEQDSEVRHLFKSLSDHLANSEFSGILQTLDERRVKGGQYLTLCNKLFLAVKNKTRQMTGVEVPSSIDGEGFGVTKAFLLTICVDAVNRASGFPLASDLKYKRELLPSNIYVLRFGANAIALAPSKDELNGYQEMHKELRTKYGQSSLSKNIAKLSTNITELETHISSELERFSLTVPVPGYCDLCKKALGLD